MRWVRALRLAVGMAGFSACLAACATAPAPSSPPKADPMGDAFQQPMRDLSLIRDRTPAILEVAALAPYEVTGVEGCGALTTELAALDAVLGPDVDVPAAVKTPGASLAADLVGGVFGLPYRGVVRFMTGAAQRDRDRKAAILAGMVRRGFLKGRQGMVCAVAKPAAP